MGALVSTNACVSINCMQLVLSFRLLAYSSFATDAGPHICSGCTALMKRGQSAAAGTRNPVIPRVRTSGLNFDFMGSHSAYV